MSIKINNTVFKLQSATKQILLKSSNSVHVLAPASYQSTLQFTNNLNTEVANRISGDNALWSGISAVTSSGYALSQSLSANIVAISASNINNYNTLVTISGSLNSKIESVSASLKSVDDTLLTTIKDISASLKSVDDSIYATVVAVSGILEGDMYDYDLALQQQLSTSFVHINGNETINDTKSFDNVTIRGNLVVNGGTIATTAQHISSSSNIISLNVGGQNPIAQGFAGVYIERGADTSASYLFVFEESRSGFAIGTSGSTQMVACREDAPVDTAIPVWDAASYSFKTYSGLKRNAAGNVAFNCTPTSNYGSNATWFNGIVETGTQFNIHTSVAGNYEIVHRGNYGFDFYTHGGTYLAVQIADNRDLICNGNINLANTINHTNNTVNSVPTIVATNYESGTYSTFQIMGSNAHGLDDWKNGVLLEAVGNAAGKGNLVLSSYNSKILFQVGARTTVGEIDATGILTLKANGTPTGVAAGAVAIGGGVIIASGSIFAGGGGAADVSNPAVQISNNRILTFGDSAGAYTNCGFIWYDSTNKLNLGAGNATRMSIKSDGQTDFEGTIYAKKVGANIRIYRDSSDEYDWGIFSSGSSLYIRNWGAATTHGEIRLGSPVIGAAGANFGGRISSGYDDPDANIATIRNSYTGGLCYTSLELSGYYPVGRIITTQNPASYVSGIMTLEVMNAANNAWTSSMTFHRNGTIYAPGNMEIGNILATNGGGCLTMTPGSVDHCYMQFYPRTANPSTRGGYMGFAGAAHTAFTFVNEIGYFSINSSVAPTTIDGGSVRIGAGFILLDNDRGIKIGSNYRLYGDVSYTHIKSPSENTKCYFGNTDSYYDNDGHWFRNAAGTSEGTINAGLINANRIDARGTNNLVLNAGSSAAAICLNQNLGTGGVIIYNGAGTSIASISSSGIISSSGSIETNGAITSKNAGAFLTNGAYTNQNSSNTWVNLGTYATKGLLILSSQTANNEMGLYLIDANGTITVIKAITNVSVQVYQSRIQVKNSSGTDTFTYCFVGHS